MKFWQQTFGQAQSKWQLAGWLMIFAFPVLALIIPKYGSTVLALGMLGGFTKSVWMAGLPGRSQKLFVFACAGYFMVGVVCFYLGEETQLGEKILGRDIRLLAAAPLILVASKLDVQRQTVEMSLIASALILGLAATIEWLINGGGIYRVMGASIPILYGHLAAALAAATTGLAIARFIRGCTLPAVVASIAVVAALTAAILSGTRGAVISVAVTLFAGLTMGIISASHRQRAMLVGVALVGIALIGIATHFGLKDRLEKLPSVLETYRKIEDLRENAARHEKLTCLWSSREFLGEFIGHFQVDGSDLITIALDDRPEMPKVNGCQPRVAIIMKNQSPYFPGWIYTPARNLFPKQWQQATVLMRGTGRMDIHGGETLEASTDLGDWKLVKLQADSAVTSKLRIYLPPQMKMEWVVVETTGGEYTNFHKTGSIGSRLGMWAGAVEIIQRNLLVGAGTGGYLLEMRRLAATGEVPASAALYDHPHNEWLTVITERGLLGLIVLVALFMTSWNLFWNKRLAQDSMRLAGRLFVLSFLTSGLTETIFNHSLGITYFLLMIVILNSPLSIERPR